MARATAIPQSRKRKLNAPKDLTLVGLRVTSKKGPVFEAHTIYDSAFLADRGCFTPINFKTIANGLEAQPSDNAAATKVQRFAYVCSQCIAR
jgi:hypothetical protein